MNKCFTFYLAYTFNSFVKCWLVSVVLWQQHANAKLKSVHSTDWKVRWPGRVNRNTKAATRRVSHNGSEQHSGPGGQVDEEV